MNAYAVAWILAGMLAFLILNWLGILQVNAPPGLSRETAPVDVIGTSPCKLSDSSTGTAGTRNGRAFCFRTGGK